MAARVLFFDIPDRFVADAIGAPGDRAFFLQVTKGTRIATVLLEKVQVALLAERIAAILLALGQTGAADAMSRIDDAPLEDPIVPEFRVATLTLVWDTGSHTFTVEARSAPDGEDEDDDEDEDEDDADEDDAGDEDVDVPDEDELRFGVTSVLAAGDESPESDAVDETGEILRVRIPVAHARAFVVRANRVVAAGRPPCPVCGEPLNPEGHLCARRNGYLN